eukprot:2350392-Heterocapsa_arctica.AAC.1
MDRRKAPSFTPLDGLQDLVRGRRALVECVPGSRRVGAEHGRADRTSQRCAYDEEQAPAHL